MNDAKYFTNIEDGIEAILTGNAGFFTVCFYDTDAKKLISLTSFRDYNQAIDFAKSSAYGIKPENNKPLYVTI